MAPKRSVEYLAVERFAKDIGRYHEYLAPVVFLQPVEQRATPYVRPMQAARLARRSESSLQFHPRNLARSSASVHVRAAGAAPRVALACLTISVMRS